MAVQPGNMTHRQICIIFICSPRSLSLIHILRFYNNIRTEVYLKTYIWYKHFIEKEDVYKRQCDACALQKKVHFFFCAGALFPEDNRIFQEIMKNSGCFPVLECKIVICYRSCNDQFIMAERNKHAALITCIPVSYTHLDDSRWNTESLFSQPPQGTSLIQLISAILKSNASRLFLQRHLPVLSREETPAL